MWVTLEILDIRQGRANRMQFYIVLALCGLALSGLLRIENVFAGVTGLLILFYILLLISVRRYRDTHPFPTKNAVVAFLCSLGLFVGSFFIFFVFVPLVLITGGKAVLSREFFGAALKSVAEDIIDPFIDLLFKASAPYLSPYGLPPQGLNFLTMAPATYPASLRQQVLGQVRSYEAEEEKVLEDESQGLDAFMARQAMKAKRRKKFLLMGDDDV